MDKSEKLKKYGKTIIATFAIILFIGVSKQVWLFDSTKDLFADLCDIFLIPGVLITTAGIMIFATSHGFFDGFGYTTQIMLRILSTDMNADREEYYEYKIRMSKKRRSSKHLLVIGSIMLLISILCLIVYMVIQE